MLLCEDFALGLLLFNTDKMQQYTLLTAHMSDAYFIEYREARDSIGAVSSLAALVSTALCSALLSQLSFSSRNFYKRILFLNILSTWLFSMSKIAFILVNNTILLDPSSRNGVLSFLLIVKTCELIAFWGTMSSSLVMIMSFIFILYNCGKMRKMEERPVHYLSYAIFLIYLILPLLTIATTKSFKITRTYCFVTIPRWTTYLSLITLTFMAATMAIMFISWRTAYKSRLIVPKLNRYLYIFTLMLTSFILCNSPYTVSRLFLTKRRTYVLEICRTIKYLEGALSAIFLYVYFIKKRKNLDKKALLRTSHA
jgi:hypothetical protein